MSEFPKMLYISPYFEISDLPTKYQEFPSFFLSFSLFRKGNLPIWPPRCITCISLINEQICGRGKSLITKKVKK